jgi:hypothetical protein
VSDTPKELKPLMDSIKQMLDDMEGHPLPSFVAPKHLQDLRKTFKEYSDCCCMEAHVIPYGAARKQ